MIFEEFVKSQPLISIIVFSFVIMLVLTLIYKFCTNQKRMKEIRDEQKLIQTQIKTEKDPQKMMGLQEQLLKKSAEQMKATMLPMFLTLLFIGPVFIFLRNLYITAKVGIILPWNFNIPVFCSILPGLCDGAGWFLCYIIFGTVFSIIQRKILKVH